MSLTSRWNWLAVMVAVVSMMAVGVALPGCAQKTAPVVEEADADADDVDTDAPEADKPPPLPEEPDLSGPELGGPDFGEPDMTETDTAEVDIVETDTAAVPAAAAAAQAAPAAPETPATPTGDEPATWKSRNFKMQLESMALGDVDGDGKTETVLITRRAIHVFRHTGDRFEKIYETKGRSSSKYIGVDIADINNNGRAEIFITSILLERNQLHSFVLEWDGKDYVRIADKMNVHFRVIPGADGPTS